MDKNTIQYLAYLLDKAKNEGKDKAIVFLGAGASATAGIPLTNVIVRHIKLKFRKNYLIKDYELNGKTDYYNLMGALTADERRDLFHFYVTRDKVRLNIANVYLAQLLKLGYVDYIVTVNFDDLVLKACTLFNFLPPVYDISNIKTVTTTDVRTGSVIYLHGQYFGQWLLNNQEELDKIENEVLSFFNTIKTRRTWVVVGYSGNDGLFEKIKSLGSFSNEFFWVKKKLNNEYDKHVIKFLNTPNTNANSIEGFYADTFFLKLHAELQKLNTKLNSPDIFYKPFSYIKSVMQNVNDVDENDELSKQVKTMIDVCNDRINKAIIQFENKESIERFKQKIIDAIINEDFNNEIALEFEREIIEKKYIKANNTLSRYYNNWGINIKNLAKLKKDEKLFEEAFTKYKKAIELKPDDYNTYNNWGIAIKNLAKLKKDEKLYKKAFSKYEKAIELKPNDYNTYYNWAIAIDNLAELKNDEKLYKKAFIKYDKAIELKPDFFNAYNNWGFAIGNLAKLKKDEKLYREAFIKYQKACELKQGFSNAYHNWASSLINYHHLLKSNKKDTFTILTQAKENALIAYKYGGNPYNLSCVYALIEEKENALKYLKETLDKNQITKEHVLKDKDWQPYLEDEDFKKLMINY